MLQTDAFAGYADLYRGGNNQEAARMAHARRKIHDEGRPGFVNMRSFAYSRLCSAPDYAKRWLERIE
ncbi:transposase IS66 [Burkholderia humptydooensis MSMB43]|uniref:Transposase IS66 n=1 Tax=Burkholderia humptydooensis MSMB43 TaxID=441157 RepID=A0ABN0FXR5_9BURK|nr:transposase IS66 [Burkholderia humptydooensis MSMB43]